MEDELYFDDPVRVYLREVQKVPALTPEEKADCVLHVRAKDERADWCGKTLIEANLHVVVSIAERSKDHRIHILDLIQKGNEGLLEALKSFANCDEENFTAHAIPYIERAIGRALLETAPISVHLREPAS